MTPVAEPKLALPFKTAEDEVILVAPEAETEGDAAEDGAVGGATDGGVVEGAIEGGTKVGAAATATELWPPIGTLVVLVPTRYARLPLKAKVPVGVPEGTVTVYETLKSIPLTKPFLGASQAHDTVLLPVTAVLGFGAALRFDTFQPPGAESDKLISLIPSSSSLDVLKLIFTENESPGLNERADILLVGLTVSSSSSSAITG